MILTQLSRLIKIRPISGITMAGSLLLLTFSCTSQESSEPAPAETKPEAEAPTAEPAAEPEKTVDITLTVTDAAGFADIIKQQEGKVVLVDFWATWCVPCVKNFHHSVEWNQQLAKQGLSVISVSMDDPEEDQESVLKFLKEQDAQFINLLATAADDKDPMETFDIDGGALPHYRIYDRSGKLIKKFSFADPSQKFTQADIETALKAALNQKSE